MKQGFTLLELSIVLVIIGLIIGGITAGAELIRGAELNSVIADVNKYKVAINTFKLKYNQLPGDMKNAKSYWPAECVDVSGNDCNGNGDGDLSTSYENMRSWQHLSLAGLVTGAYTGVGANSITNYMLPPENVPASKIGGLAGYKLMGWTLYQKKSNAMLLSTAGTSGFMGGGALNTPEAQAIDEKSDDGKSSTGSINGYSASTGCVDALPTAASSNYILSNKVVDCVLFFRF